MRSHTDSPTIWPSQCVPWLQGPDWRGTGTSAPQLDLTKAMPCGTPEPRFFQSSSRTPVHSVQGSPLPGQVCSLKKPRPMQDVFRRRMAAMSA